MSKQTTSNKDLAVQLDELKGLLANQERGHVISVDRQLQEMNATLQRLLYATVVKYGIHMRQENNVIATAQLPVVQSPLNHQLQWEVAGDGQSVMVYIIADSPEESHEADSTAEGDGGGGPVAAVPSENPPPDPGEDIDDDEFSGVIGIGDEFEDEIVVGLGDEGDTDGD